MPLAWNVQSNLVRRLGVARRGAPAGGESPHSPGAAWAFDHQSIVAPIKPAVQPRGLADGDVERSFSHTNIAAGAAPLPAAVLLQPIIAPIFPDQRPSNGRGHTAACGINRDDLEAHKRRAGGGRVPFVDLDPQIDWACSELQGLILANRPATGLKHRSGHRRDQGISRIARLAGRHRQPRVTGTVSHGRTQIDKLLVKRLLLVAEDEAVVLREWAGISAKARLALSLQTRADRAIEKARIHIHYPGLAKDDGNIRAPGDGHRQPLRREVLHSERKFASGSIIAVDMQFGRPVAARRVSRQIQIGRQGAAARTGEGEPFELHARGPLDQDETLAVGYRFRLAISGQGDQMSAFSRTIDAPIGIEISVDPGRGLAPSQGTIPAGLRACLPG